MNAAYIAKTLRDNGQSMTLTRTTVGTFDPVTGSPGTPVVQAWTVYGITKNYNSQRRLSAQNAPGSLIMSGDKMTVIGAEVVEPIPGDVLTIMGKAWTVIAVDELSPQGSALMYTAQIRK